MVFSSVIFVMCFLPFVLIVHTLLYFILKKTSGNTRLISIIMNSFLLLMSIIFYAWGEFSYLYVMLSIAFLDYIFAIIIDKVITKRRKRIVLCISITLNLSILLFFKYMNYFTADINFLSNVIINRDVIAITNIALPLGISFYTFQGISYLIDVYRGEVKSDKNIINFLSYLSMFPQLVAGPIVRYSSIAYELKNRMLSVSNFSDGAKKFIYGLAKKVLIADTMGKVADVCFSFPNAELSVFSAWVGVLAYTLQIYFDFSGYSDMAIGMGMMLGFTFPENFNYPYVAKSIQEFWHRWHISLSTWFKDYLYIPLGGNRKGKFRTYFNLLLVFILCGFWHGANTVFILWGLYYGIFLVLERVFPSMLKNLPSLFRHIYSLIIIIFGWVIFRSNDIHQMLGYFKSLFGFNSANINDSKVMFVLHSGDVLIAFILGVILSTPIYRKFKQFAEKRGNSFLGCKAVLLSMEKLLAIVLLIVCLLPLFGSTYKSFIYFRF